MNRPLVEIVLEGKDERMAELAVWLERMVRGKGCEPEAVIRIAATPTGMLAEGIRGECRSTCYVPWESWRLASAANSVLHDVLVPLGLLAAAPPASEDGKEDELIAEQLKKLGYL